MNFKSYISELARKGAGKQTALRRLATLFYAKGCRIRHQHRPNTGKYGWPHSTLEDNQWLPPLRAIDKKSTYTIREEPVSKFPVKQSRPRPYLPIPAIVPTSPLI